MIVHNSVLVLPGSSGSRWMPRNIAGRLISTIEALTTAVSMPTVVLDSTIHLWRGDRAISVIENSAIRAGDGAARLLGSEDSGFSRGRRVQLRCDLIISMLTNGH